MRLQQVVVYDEAFYPIFVGSRNAPNYIRSAFRRMPSSHAMPLYSYKDNLRQRRFNR